jgi:hypothetical protein
MDFKWHFKDIIDLEFFLRKNERKKNSSEKDLSGSLNRSIFLDFARSNPPPLSRRNLLRYWVEQKRIIEKQVSNAPPATPGKAAHESYTIIRAILIFLSIISGGSLAWTLLSYSGNTPINIFTYIWVMILPQLFLIAVLILSLCIRRVFPSKDFRGMYPLLTSLIRSIALKLKRAGEVTLSAERRNLSRNALGLMGRQKTLYGSILFWPIFNLFQIFGVCFNIGALCATFIKVTIVDLAFGWQSTLQIAPESLYQFIKYTSLPWSWCVPAAYAHPTLAQIEGSRMVLKDGMVHLATTNLVSWWPFLCLAVLFYGFLPRLFLLSAGIWRQHRLMNRMNFTQADCDRLIQQMQTPRMSTLSRPFHRQASTSSITVKPEPADHESLADSGESMPAAIIFVPEDIDHLFAEDEMADRMLTVFRLRILGRIRLSMEFVKDKDALKQLMNQTDVSLSSTRLIILQEAWQPPIRETISWIKNLRGAVGEKTGIIIALIGKQANEIKFTSPHDTDLLIWEHVINGMGDPYIRIENLGG